MGCPSKVQLGNNLTFSICTHDPDTGVLTDAEEAPPYRVYEDETGTPILTGSMAKLDDANTTGFYSELIACTEGNGFEAGKSYTIYIEATIDSDKGGISYGFLCEHLATADEINTAIEGGAIGTAVAAIQAVTDAIPDAGALTDLLADIASILADTGTDGVVLKAAGLNADAVDEILDEVVEGTVTVRQALTLILSFISGKCSGGGTTTITYRDIGDTKDRIVMTVDSDGDRSEIGTRDGS